MIGPLINPSLSPMKRFLNIFVEISIFVEPNLPVVKVVVEHVPLWYQTSKAAKSTTTPSMLVLLHLPQETG